MFYVIEDKYVGPNQDQHIDADTITIRTTPAKTNMSHETKLWGWCGTTNDWAVHAYGEHETLEAARYAVFENFGSVRLVEDEDKDDTVIETYKIGQYIPMSEEETGDWIYAGMRSEIHSDTTDEDIAKFIAECESNANSEFNSTLDGNAEDMVKKYRQELRDEAFESAEMKFGTAECGGVAVALLGQAELTNRLFNGCYSDVSDGESYISERSCKGIDRNGEQYEIIWRFDEVKGSELEDAGSYDWSQYEIKQV